MDKRGRDRGGRRPGRSLTGGVGEGKNHLLPTDRCGKSTLLFAQPVVAGQDTRPETPVTIQGGRAVIVIPRKKGESVVIDDNIILTVIEVRGDKVRLGIEYPRGVTVHRH